MIMICAGRGMVDVATGPHIQDGGSGRPCRAVIVVDDAGTVTKMSGWNVWVVGGGQVKWYWRVICGSGRHSSRNTGAHRAQNPAYGRVTQAIRRARGRGDRDTVHTLRKQQRALPSVDPD